MKFKTKMEGSVVAVKTLHDNVSGVISDLGHDAAIAHALFLAMDQWGTDEFGVVDALRSRADELLQQWGYKE